MNSSIPNQTKEKCLSRAFVHAIASYAGFNVIWRGLDFAIDGSFKKVIHHGQRFFEIGIPLDFQLKATINWSEDADHIIYDMEAKTYNDFIYWERNTSTPVRLILLCLPRDENEWLYTDNELLRLRHCCYYTSISGDITENTSTKRILISKENLLTPETLIALVESIQEDN